MSKKTKKEAADSEAVDVSTEVVSSEPVINEKDPVQEILKRGIILTGTAGLIPTPILDMASISALQVNMIAELSAHYKVPFKENLCKNIIASLIGGTGAVALSGGAVASLMKTIPVIGTVGGMLTLPIMAGGATYALGKIFIEHFESGGTLLDFKAESVKDTFKKEFQEGKKVTADLKDEILRKNKSK